MKTRRDVDEVGFGEGHRKEEAKGSLWARQIEITFSKNLAR
jgi:hypothetical protein